MAAVPKFETELDYPSSDGKPMAETDVHRQVMFDLIEGLRDRYSEDPDVYVSGDLLLFYEPGNKRKHVAPDVFVVFGVPKRDRLNYLAWLEAKPPDFIVEVTSKSTHGGARRKSSFSTAMSCGLPNISSSIHSMSICNRRFKDFA